jgi:hypothetical protein
VLEQTVKRGGGEWPGALLARRTRTIRMCSFDARSQGQPRPLPLADGWSSRGEWRLMIFCARATRGRGRLSPGLMARLGVPVGGRVRRLRAVGDHLACPLCRKWSAHDKNVLARRPQLDHYGCHSREGEATRGRVGMSGEVPFLLAEGGRVVR